jgi:hypothetical protein
MTGQVGPRGAAILVLAAITGILLAILGWSQRDTGLPPPHVGGLPAVVVVSAAPGRIAS